MHSALMCVLQICLCSSKVSQVLIVLGPLYSHIKFVSLFNFQEKRNSTRILIEILLIAIKLVFIGFSVE